jgi:hypothetical protein
MPYKIHESNGYCSIQKDNMSIPRSVDNSDYNRFIEDIALDKDTVEGPDIVSESYAVLRASEYPSIQAQLDMQYWDAVNGTTTWKDAIDAIKTEYPKTIQRTVTVGSVPAWVQEEADAFLFDKQLREYAQAVARIAQYRLADGRAELLGMLETPEKVFNEETMELETVMMEAVILSAIEPLDATVIQVTYDADRNPIETEVPNPLIINDNAEREAAQAIINNTDQAVRDHYEATK